MTSEKARSMRTPNTTIRFTAFILNGASEKSGTRTISIDIQSVSIQFPTIVDSLARTRRMRPRSFVGFNESLTPMSLLLVPTHKGKIGPMIAIFVSVRTHVIIFLVPAIANRGMRTRRRCMPMINRSTTHHTIVFVAGIITIVGTGVRTIFVQFFERGNDGRGTIGGDGAEEKRIQYNQPYEMCFVHHTRFSLRLRKRALGFLFCWRRMNDPDSFVERKKRDESKVGNCERWMKVQKKCAGMNRA
jgi:hypothetical protein